MLKGQHVLPFTLYDSFFSFLFFWGLYSQIVHASTVAKLAVHHAGVLLSMLNQTHIMLASLTGLAVVKQWSGPPGGGEEGQSLTNHCFTTPHLQSWPYIMLVASFNPIHILWASLTVLRV
jgi:hypothetical protein